MLHQSPARIVVEPIGQGSARESRFMVATQGRSEQVCLFIEDLFDMLRHTCRHAIGLHPVDDILRRGPQVDRLGEEGVRQSGQPLLADSPRQLGPGLGDERPRPGLDSDSPSRFCSVQTHHVGIDDRGPLPKSSSPHDRAARNRHAAR